MGNVRAQIQAPARSAPFASAAPSSRAPVVSGRSHPTEGETGGGADGLEQAARVGHNFASLPVQNQPPPGRSTPGAAPIQRVKFTPQQRARILARNRQRNGGFYTCENGACGFQHALTQYATYRGRRVGDGGFHIDHIHHHGRGGRNLIGNGRVLCGTCNTSRGARANAQRYGINKYRGLHRKRALKDYRSIRRNY